MELQETSMTRICEPRTRCYRSIRSAVRSLGPWASHGGDSAGGATHLGWCRVATDSNLEPTDSEGPWWPLVVVVATGNEIANTGDGMRRLSLNVAIFGIIRHF